VRSQPTDLGSHVAALLTSNTDTASADDPNRVVTVTAHEGKTGQEMAITYTNYKVVGNGSFGVVFAAKMLRAYPFNPVCCCREKTNPHSDQDGGRNRRRRTGDCDQEGASGQAVQEP
jgi:hypothetical protein